METPEQTAMRIADSLTGYIAHIPGSYSCRHCEVAQEIADTLRAAIHQTAQEDAAIAQRFQHVTLCNHARVCGEVAAAIRKAHGLDE